MYVCMADVWREGGGVEIDSLDNMVLLGYWLGGKIMVVVLG